MLLYKGTYKTWFVWKSIDNVGLYLHPNNCWRFSNWQIRRSFLLKKTLSVFKLIVGETSHLPSSLYIPETSRRYLLIYRFPSPEPQCFSYYIHRSHKTRFVRRRLYRFNSYPFSNRSVFTFILISKPFFPISIWCLNNKTFPFFLYFNPLYALAFPSI